MFRGQHNQSIDPKGRIILPAKFREVLVSQYDCNLVITKHQDICLMAYPVEEWLKKENELKQLPTGKKEVRMLKRFYMASASECAMDRQGRIVIPPSLKEFARFEKNIVVTGAIDHFEIWNRELFNAFTDPDQEIHESEDIQAINDLLGF